MGTTEVALGNLATGVAVEEGPHDTNSSRLTNRSILQAGYLKLDKLSLLKVKCVARIFPKIHRMPELSDRKSATTPLMDRLYHPRV